MADQQPTIHLHPIGPTAFDALMAKLNAMQYILMRTETRLCKLIQHVGAEHLIETVDHKE